MTQLQWVHIATPRSGESKQGEVCIHTLTSQEEFSNKKIAVLCEWSLQPPILRDDVILAGPLLRDDVILAGELVCKMIMNLSRAHLLFGNEVVLTVLTETQNRSQTSNGDNFMTCGDLLRSFVLIQVHVFGKFLQVHRLGSRSEPGRLGPNASESSREPVPESLRVGTYTGASFKRA
jgi:hypothetical protein